MLHFIRDRAQGWIAWFIVGLITIPFALWGVNSYLTGPSDVVVAEVNGHDIKQAELQQSIQQYRDQMRRMMGEQFDPSLFEGALVKRNILDGLIEQRLIQDANAELGQQVSDAEVSTLVMNTPAFQRDGKFDSEYYEMVLARAGYNPSRYEARLRSDLMAQELTQNIQSTVLATPQALAENLRLQQQKREIAYGLVPAQDFMEQVEVTDEEVKAIYEKNEASYTSPEHIKVNYLQLSVDDIAAGLTVDEADLKKFYADNQDKFVGPVQRRVSHILVEGDDEGALAQIEALAQRLVQGEDFAALAKEASADSGSAAQGGDLGFFQRDVMDPAFEEAAFSLENIGDVSEPVKTEFGYHLIKLTGIKEAEGQSFADARDEVEKQYRLHQAETVFYDKAEQLANLSYENPDNLDIAAEALGLDIKTSETFTRNGTEAGIASDPKVVNAAFSEDVLDHDLNSNVIELSDTNLVVLHKNTYTAAASLPYESVSPAIREQLKFNKARDKAREQGSEILTQLRSGTDAASLLENWQAAAFYGRQSDDISAQILEQGFAMPKPEQTAQYAGFTASNGNYIVLKLTAVEEGDVTAEMSEEEQATLKQQLTSMYANAEIQAFLDALRADANIKIFDDAL